MQYRKIYITHVCVRNVMGSDEVVQEVFRLLAGEPIVRTGSVWW
jgi:hypothetical protein